MWDAVSYLTLCSEKRSKIDLCQSEGAVWMRVSAGVLLLHGTQANQNTRRYPHLACATYCDFVDLEGWLANSDWDRLAFLAAGAYA